MQTMPAMLDLLANVGRPSTDSRENSVVAGVRRALELLCQLSPRQIEVTHNRLDILHTVLKTCHENFVPAPQLVVTALE